MKTRCKTYFASLSRRTVCLTLLVFSTFLTSFSQGQDEQSPPNQWNQWRGIHRTSIIEGNWPAKLDSSNLKQLWQELFYESYSGPIVFDDTIITTETKDKTYEVVTALNKKTGDKIWSAQWKGAMKVPFFAARNGSWIRATPATDGKHVYVPGIQGLLVCLDFKTGKEIWRVDLNKRYGTSPESFGHVCSPLLMKEGMDNALYVQCSAGFVKLNRDNGEEIWKTSLGAGNIMSGGAFSSPIVASPNGKKQIIIQTRSELAGVDIQKGNILWKRSVPAFRGMNILTPTVQGNTFFTSTYNNKSFAYDLVESGGKPVLESKWESNLRAYMSSPVVIDGNVYVHLQNKQIACFNLESGKSNWVSKSRTRFGDYMSMIGCGKQILALDSKGVLYLIAANPEKFEVQGKVDLETKDSWAHLAVDGNYIFVRGIKTLTAYQWK